MIGFIDKVRLEIKIKVSERICFLTGKKYGHIVTLIDRRKVA